MKTPARLILYGIVFFAFFDLFAQLPVMSTFAISVGATPFLAGFSIAIYSLANTFGNVLSGVWTDRKGAYHALLTGLLLSGMSLLMYQLVETATMLLIVRVVHGFTAGLIVPAAFTLSANVTNRERQGKKVAITGSFVGLAAIVGPAFSGIVASMTSAPTVFAVVAFVGLVMLFLGKLYLGDVARSIPVTHKEKVVEAKLGPGVNRAYIGAFLLMFSQGALAFLLPLYVEALGYDSRLSGTLLSMFGAVAVLFFLLPTNQLADRFDPVKLTALGIAIIGLSQLMIGFSDSRTMLYAVLAFYGIGFAILFPAINAQLIRSTTPSNRGKAYGYFYAFFSLGTVAGSSLLSGLPVTLTTQFTMTGTFLLLASSLFIVRHKYKQTSMREHR